MSDPGHGDKMATIEGLDYLPATEQLEMDQSHLDRSLLGILRERSQRALDELLAEACNDVDQEEGLLDEEGQLPTDGEEEKHTPINIMVSKLCPSEELSQDQTAERSESDDSLVGIVRERSQRALDELLAGACAEEEVGPEESRDNLSDPEITNEQKIISEKNEEGIPNKTSKFKGHAAKTGAPGTHYDAPGKDLVPAKTPPKTTSNGSIAIGIPASAADQPLLVRQDRFGTQVGAHAVDGPLAPPMEQDTISSAEISCESGAPELSSHTDPFEVASLSEALLVEDDSIHDLEIQPFDVDAVDRRAAKRAKQEKCVLAMVIVLMVLAGVLAPVLVLVPNWGSEQDDESSPSPTPLPSQPPTMSQESYILSLFPNQTQKSIDEDATSSQAQAYNWIMADPNLMTYSHERIVQRFALGALFYATNGDDWIRNTNWMSYEVHECKWYSSDLLKTVGNFGEGSAFPIPEVIYNAAFLPLVNESFPCGDPVVAQQYSHLWLIDNDLQGHLPPEIYLLTALKTMYLSGAGLTGPGLPTEIGKLSALESIGMTFAGFSGTIPTEIGMLTRMGSLFIHYTQMSGTIPTQLSLLSDNLKVLDFAEMQLTGTIPASLGSLPNIIFLDFSRNTLSGSTPTELGMLQDAEFFNFQGNQLSGVIPSQLGKLRKLKWLQLYENKLEGSIPSDLGLIQNMTGGIVLLFNQLSGTIPSQLGMLEKIVDLWLDLNHLTGPIPSQLGRLENAEVLMLHSNQLTGTMPRELGMLTNAQVISLGGLNLEGTIPSELGRLQSARELYLDTNHFTGSVPWEVSNLVPNGSLEVFHIYSNNLTGTLPSDLCSVETVSDYNSQLIGCNCNCSFVFYYPNLKICSPLSDRCA